MLNRLINVHYYSMQKLLIYVDHGAFRKLYERLEEYIKDVEEHSWIILSTIPIVLSYEPVDNDIIWNLANKWLSITYSTRYVESIVVLLEHYRRRIIGEKEFIIKMLHTISEKLEYIEDLYLTNILMKIATNMAFPDLGILVIYEDPLSIEQGRRAGLVDISNVLVKKKLKVVYESKIHRSIRTLEINTAIVRKKSSSTIVVTDWSNLGLYPYSGYNVSTDNEGRRLADPILCSYLKYRVDLVTNIMYRDVIINFTKFQTSNYVRVIRELDKSSVNIVTLPETMSTRDIDRIITALRRHNVNVSGILNIPLDIFLELFLYSIGGS